jgi:hypothetical protein
VSTSDDEFRDPTAPPPLPDDTDADAGDGPAGSPDPTPEAPSVDDTQVVDAGSTQSFTPPSGGYTPPTYDGPTYSTPSYEQPTYGSPYGQPPATPPAAAAPPPPAPWDQPAAGYPYGPGTPGAPQAPYQQAPHQQGAYQQGAYQQAGPPSPYPYAAPPSAYGAPQRNTSALVLTIISGVLAVFCCSVLTVPALIFGIVGLTKQDTDPEGSRRASRNGWIAFSVGIAITVIGLVIFFAIGLSGGFDDPSGYDSTYDGY